MKSLKSILSIVAIVVFVSSSFATRKLKTKDNGDGTYDLICFSTNGGCLDEIIITPEK